MIVFDLSKKFYFTLCILILGVGFDNVGVIIRATIIRIYTPDEICGRVSSVNIICNFFGKNDSGCCSCGYKSGAETKKFKM